MQLYLTISRGQRADVSIPIIAVSDQRLIRRVLSQFVLMMDDNEQRITARGRKERHDLNDERRNEQNA